MPDKSNDAGKQGMTPEDPDKTPDLLGRRRVLGRVEQLLRVGAILITLVALAEALWTIAQWLGLR